MWQYQNTDELYHYGVPGMKWGHRKSLSQIMSDRKAYRQKYKENYKQIKKNSSLKDKLLYSTGTRKQAAKYMTKNNMSEKEAVSKAKKNAWRNTAIIGASAVAAYGGYKLGQKIIGRGKKRYIELAKEELSRQHNDAEKWLYSHRNNKNWISGMNNFSGRYGSLNITANKMPNSERLDYNMRKATTRELLGLGLKRNKR